LGTASDVKPTNCETYEEKIKMTINSIIRHCLISAWLITVLSVGAWAEFGRVNINTATDEEISENLIGIGPSKAQAIVAYREEFGLFEDVDELINVRGIGLRTVDQNRDRLTISSSDPRP
jgi:competence protein ComEA